VEVGGEGGESWYRMSGEREFESESEYEDILREGVCIFGIKGCDMCIVVISDKYVMFD